MAQVDLKRKLIHSHNYKALKRFCRGFEVGNEEKLMKDTCSKAGGQLKDYYLTN